MLGCIAFSVYCHTASTHKCKRKHIRMLNTALDLAAVAKWIGWGGVGKLNGGNIV